MNRLRVATYNVHKCRGIDWRTSVPRVMKVMRGLDADVIAAQEIFLSQADCLASGLGVQHVFAGVRTLNGQEYGNAVFTRLSIAGFEQFDLTVDGHERRGCLRVCLKPGLVQVFAVHLGTSFFERRRQATRLLSAQVVGRPEFRGRRIVVGDFNEWTNGLTTRMMSHSLASADIATHLNRSRTYPGVLPFLHLDHIYYDPQFHLSEMRLHRTAASVVASDHLPLSAAFTTNPDCQS